MTKVTNDMLAKFTAMFDAAQTRVGGGQIRIDIAAVRAAVRAHPDAAYAFVEVYCVMAASQPGYLQPALIVATAYQAEFEDATLLDLVNSRATEVNGGQHLERIRVAQPPPEQSPERQAARDWWATCGRDEAQCDSCAAPVRRDEGFLLDGRVTSLGASKINMGTELFCLACFEEHRDEPRDPDRTDEDYMSIP